MTHLQITAAVSVVLITALATSQVAQAQVVKRDNARVNANVRPAVSPDANRPANVRPAINVNADRPTNVKPRPTPRFNWRKLWNNPKAQAVTVEGVDGTCRTTATASLEATDGGVKNTGTETQRLSCRMSLGEPGTSYQVSVLTDHSASETFECAAGPVKASGRHARRTGRMVELEESENMDRDEWLFIASRRLNTVAVRCRIPAGGVVREIVVTDCGVNTCAAGS